MNFWHSAKDFLLPCKTISGKKVRTAYNFCRGSFCGIFLEKIWVFSSFENLSETFPDFWRKVNCRNIKIAIYVSRGAAWVAFLDNLQTSYHFGVWAKTLWTMGPSFSERLSRNSFWVCREEFRGRKLLKCFISLFLLSDFPRKLFGNWAWKILAELAKQYTMFIDEFFAAIFSS